MVDEKRAAKPKNGKKIGVAVLALLYVLSPLDLIPESLLPVVGWLDDAGILVWAVRYIAASPKRRPAPLPPKDGAS